MLANMAPKKSAFFRVERISQMHCAHCRTGECEELTADHSETWAIKARHNMDFQVMCTDYTYMPLHVRDPDGEARVACMTFLQLKHFQFPHWHLTYKKSLLIISIFLLYIFPSAPTILTLLCKKARQEVSSITPAAKVDIGSQNLVCN